MIQRTAFVTSIPLSCSRATALAPLSPSRRPRTAWVFRPPSCVVQAPTPAPPPPSTSTSPSTSRSNGKRAKFGRAPSATPQLTVDGDSLQPTPQQHLLVSSHFLLSFSLLGRLGMHGDLHILPLVAAFLFTDFAIGVYHHAVDNYGSENTPVLGFQIAAFQGHHTYPWTITARSFSNNLYRLTYPTLPQLIALSFLFPVLPPALVAFWSTTLGLIVMSQETHRQAHMLKPHRWASMLQKAGIIVSQKNHAKHHTGAHHSNYCILTGHCNWVLDKFRFFRLLEAIVFIITANEPLCWGEDPRLKVQSMSILRKLRFVPFGASL